MFLLVLTLLLLLLGAMSTNTRDDDVHPRMSLRTTTDPRPVVAIAAAINGTSAGSELVGVEFDRRRDIGRPSPTSGVGGGSPGKVRMAKMRFMHPHNK
jgi:hypothetical protein